MINAGIDIPFTVINGASLLVCLLAAVLVFGLKLYKKLVYRLSLYQVLASLAFSTVQTLQIIFIGYDNNPQVYAGVCTAIGWFGMYTRWVKVLFTMWVAFHLFCFAVLHKNLTKLEVLYVVTSLLIPAVIAMVPLTTHTYGLSPLQSYCSVYSSNGTDHAHIQLYVRLAIWDIYMYIPAMIILIVSSAAMVVMVIHLAYKTCWKSRYEPITEGDQFQKAVKQLLPLAAFPILFFVFVLPQVIFHIVADKSPTPPKALQISAFVFISLWSMASGITLIIHLCVSLQYTRRKRSILRYNSASKATVGNESTYVNSKSSFVMLNSIGDE